MRGPDVLWGGDIRRFHPPASKFDGVIGGPPCQAFSSLAHLVRANGHEPRFGNLIPEYERCVLEAQPDWFVMENVPQAPEPVVPGYGIRSFLLDNSALDGGDGFGLEQRRVRRFSFGLRGREAPCLLRWIDLAVFLLPDASSTQLWSPGPDNRKESKDRGRVARRRQAVQGGHDATPWQRDGDTKRKPGARLTAVSARDGGERPSEKKARRNRVPPAVAAHGYGEKNAGKAKHTGRYRLSDACRLQGLPEIFLADAPFTAEGKLKAVANGVPIPMGRAIARAVKKATA